MPRLSLARIALAAAPLVAVAPSTLADGQDIGLVLFSGQIKTIAVEGEPPLQNFGAAETRVFGADLEWNPTAGIVVIDEPGYASQDPALLGRPFTFNLLAAARQWNGASFVPTSQTLATGLPDLGLPFIATPATDTTVFGYTWNLSDDFHFEWTLPGGTETTGQGIYLAQLQLSTPGFDATAPFWIVFNYGLTEAEHDAAIEYAQANFVPAPGAAALLSLGGLLALRRRR